jgi:bifunctional non-homologous end joining protein LigD
MSLKEYHRKRDFKKTREPKGKTHGPGVKKPVFVIQEHHARRLHWDFRLEAKGVLKSWAVTREPTMNTADRRLAIETEDHPLDYAKFHGKIPAGEYGAGDVMIWDHGTFESSRDVAESIDSGVVSVHLHGKKLTGKFVLVRTNGEGPKAQWLFFKAKPKPVALKVPKLAQIRARRYTSKKKAA